MDRSFGCHLASALALLMVPALAEAPLLPPWQRSLQITDARTTAPGHPGNGNGDDGARGQQRLSLYQCGGCHHVPGKTMPSTGVAPRDTRSMTADLALLL